MDCAAATTVEALGSATASDDCSGATITHSDSVAAGNCAGNYVITRTWTATDGCGNAASATQTINVTDTHAPSITDPTAADVGCGVATTVEALGSATASDDCSGATVTHSDSVAAGNCAGNYVITRTWTATDGCGNAASAAATRLRPRRPST